MRNKTRLALGALIVICSSALAQETNNSELPNFHQVNPQLYRGAQPKRGGFTRLAQLGIRTVVNLRGRDESAQAEADSARNAGLRYFNVPMKRAGRPTDEQITSVLTILNDAENQPVFVHCAQGVDRTGTIIAVYRIVHDGWTSARAKAEANKYGMHLWEVGMKDYIHDCYERRKPKTVAPRQPAGVPQFPEKLGSNLRRSKLQFPETSGTLLLSHCQR